MTPPSLFIPPASSPPSDCSTPDCNTPDCSTPGAGVPGVSSSAPPPELHRAVRRGDLWKAQLLYTTRRFTTADARAGQNRLLRLALRRGFLDIASWLASEFDLTLADAQARKCEALRVACERGDLAVVRWLHDTFDLPPDATRIGRGLPLRLACAGGHGAVVCWLLDAAAARDALTGAVGNDRELARAARDLVRGGCEALHAAHNSGHREFVQWVVEWLKAQAPLEAQRAQLHLPAEYAEIA